MKRILLASGLLFCVTSFALAQARRTPFEPGVPGELRGLTKVFLAPPGIENPVDKKIAETIKKKLPQISFVSTPGDAEILLRLHVAIHLERNRVPPNPNDTTGVSREYGEIEFTATGQIVRFPADGPLRLLQEFRRRGSDRKTLAEEFAKEFVRAYQQANIGLELPNKLASRQRSTPAIESQAIRPSTVKTYSLKDPQPPEDDVDVFRVNTNLVTINVSVVDRDNRYLSTLSKDTFSVYDEGVKQELSFFAGAEEKFTVALLIDTSRSVTFKLKDIVLAANSFVDQLRPDDRLMVVAFDSDVKEIIKTTKSSEVKGKGISITAGVGRRTLIYDAVAFTIKERLNRIPGRKAIILLTDGISDDGRSTYKGSIRDAEEAGALIYPIQFDTYPDATQHFKGPTAKRMVDVYKGLYKRGTAYLEELAEKTGGRFYEADAVNNFSQAFASIVKELTSQYTLGYYPRPLPKEGEPRRVKVGVDLQNVRVRARSNYIFTSPKITRQ